MTRDTIVGQRSPSSAIARAGVGGDEALPPDLVLIAPVGAVVESVPAAMLDRHGRRAIGVGAKVHLNFGRIFGVGEDVPRIDQPIRGLPVKNCAPVFFLTALAALVYAPVCARLECDRRATSA